MQLSKEKLQHFVNNMPEKMDVVDIIDKMLLMAKIEQANEEVINHYAPQDELEKEIDLWG
ncbi:MAG: hypothetical protein ACHQHN_15655 [Sphingobacteriales bacterium]